MFGDVLCKFSGNFISNVNREAGIQIVIIRSITFSLFLSLSGEIFNTLILVYCDTERISFV